MKIFSNKQTNKQTLIKASLFALALLSDVVGAAVITPVSYGFDQPTSSGAYTYHDTNPIPTKLTDGALGYAGWAADNGAAWDGWLYTNVNIDFKFGSKVEIDTINVGSTQNSLGDVVLPSLNIFASDDGSSWNLINSLIVPPNSTNDVNPYSTAPHGFLTLNDLGINSSFVRVQAIANGPWTFIDEVRFSNTISPVPLPAAAWLFTTGLLGMAGFVRRKSRAKVL
ncbi:MAG: VPLPA-CTERM sorting domain-containing protein [Methyloglobulus sp.]